SRRTRTLPLLYQREKRRQIVPPSIQGPTTLERRPAAGRQTLVWPRSCVLPRRGSRPCTGEAGERPNSRPLPSPLLPSSTRFSSPTRIDMHSKQHETSTPDRTTNGSEEWPPPPFHRESQACK